MFPNKSWWMLSILCETGPLRVKHWQRKIHFGTKVCFCQRLNCPHFLKFSNVSFRIMKSKCFKMNIKESCFQKFKSTEVPEYSERTFIRNVSTIFGTGHLRVNLRVIQKSISLKLAKMLYTGFVQRASGVVF